MSDEDYKIGARIFFLIFCAGLGAGAYLIWPDGITDLPLAAITLGALLKAIGSALMAIACFFCFLAVLDPPS